MKSVKVFAPASIGNVGPGFDFLGLAIQAIGDIVHIEKTRAKNILIEIVNGDNGIPLDPQHNTAGLAAMEVMALLGCRSGLKIKIEKGIPPGSGMGSSAASAVAAGYAVNVLFSDRLGKDGILEAVTKAEEQVSGAFFCDNTASSLFGGLVLTKSYDPLEVIKLGVIEDVVLVLVKPDIKLLTREARGAVPEMVCFKDALANSANSCAIVASTISQNPQLFGSSICDSIIEPARAGMIPGFYKAKEAAMDSGALGCTISGAGPTVFAVTLDREAAEAVAQSIAVEFNKVGLSSTSYITGVDRYGARVVEGEL